MEAKLKILGFYNSLGLPGLLRPIFVDTSGRNFAAITDETGIITDFEVVSPEEIIKQNLYDSQGDSKGFYGIGEEINHGFLLPDGRFIYLPNTESLIILLNTITSSEMLNDFPFIGLSLARKIGSYQVEGRFADLCVRKIFHKSPDIAAGWVRCGAMSDQARMIAQETFLECAKDGGGPLEWHLFSDRREFKVWVSRKISELFMEVDPIAEAQANLTYGMFDISKYQLPTMPLRLILLAGSEESLIDESADLRQSLQHLLQEGCQVISFGLTKNRSFVEVKASKDYLSAYWRYPRPTFSVDIFIDQMWRKFPDFG